MSDVAAIRLFPRQSLRRDGPAAAFTGGVPLLSAARLLVEAAFGANLRADITTWSWTDIAGDVRQANRRGILVTQGRGDETSQASPAGCTFELDNSTGNYSTGNPGSVYWPNVKRNTPIRVSIDPGTGRPILRFQGYADGWTPGWDASANLAIVRLSASGILRRLQQGKTPLKSPLYRAISRATPAPVAWWSLEDGSLVTAPTAVIGTPMVAAPASVFSHLDTGTVSGSVAGPPGGATAADMSKGGQLTGYVSGTSGTSWRLGIAFQYKEPVKATESSNVVTIATVDAAGNPGWWRFSAAPSGANNWAWEFGIEGVSTTLDDGTPALDDGNWHWLEIQVQNGAGTNATYTLSIDGVVRASGTDRGFIKAGTLTRVLVADSGDLDAASHLVVWPTNAALSQSIYDAFTGYAGETVTARLTRLCGEEDVPIAITGASDILMGAQGTATFLALLRECEATDHGVLADGLGPGLRYVTRSARYNLPAALTADMSADPADISAPFAPVDDDQRDRNHYRVDRKNASFVVFEDTDGPLGADAIGTYDSSATVNTQTDDVLDQHASWLVRLGTVEGLRYPNLFLDLAVHPSLIAAWLAAGDNTRADVVNITDLMTQHPPGDVQLLIEGYREILPSQLEWRVEANCSPYQPWRVPVIEGAGDTGWRLDSGGSTLAANVPPGSTSLSVVVSDGVLWSTVAGDYPRDIDVGGVQVTVTAVSGAASPQTFTITPVAYLLPAGATVKLWRAPALAL